MSTSPSVPPRTFISCLCLDTKSSLLSAVLWCPRVLAGNIVLLYFNVSDLNQVLVNRKPEIMVQFESHQFLLIIPGVFCTLYAGSILAFVFVVLDEKICFRSKKLVRLPTFVWQKAARQCSLQGVSSSSF